MPRLIPKETKKKILRLYRANPEITASEIAREIPVSYSSACLLIRTYKAGYSSSIKYLNAWAADHGFIDYREYLKKLIKDRGYRSEGEYLAVRITKRGHSSVYQYNKQYAKSRGYENLTEYITTLVKAKGYRSLSDYYKKKERKRQRDPRNRIFSYILKQRLDEIGMTNSWLAEQLGITEGAVSRYLHAKTTPRFSRQEEIFRLLDLPYKTIDDVLIAP
jgi:hypothetical protein